MDTIKQTISMNLSDIPLTAQVCKALSSEVRLEILRMLVDQSMSISDLAEELLLPLSSVCLHIKVLKEADLINVIPKPGLRGSQKLCGIKAPLVVFDVFAHTKLASKTPPAFVNMPIGNYSCCQVSPPCGLASEISYLYYEDSPYGFYSPDRTSASLLWFSKGFLEYQFSNHMLLQVPPEQIEFSFEVCSEAPGFNNNWPSDITVEINHIPVITFMVAGDYGGRLGNYNPAWWSSSNTQYGEYKRLYIRKDGCYMNNRKVSNETIISLGMKDGYSFTFCLKVDENSEHVGGMNLFGKHFGDYAQDITMKVEYE